MALTDDEREIIAICSEIHSDHLTFSGYTARVERLLAIYRHEPPSCSAGLPTESLECPKHPGQYGDH